MINKVIITMKNRDEFVSQIPAEYGKSHTEAYEFVANSQGLKVNGGWVIITVDNISSMFFCED